MSMDGTKMGPVNSPVGDGSAGSFMGELSGAFADHPKANAWLTEKGGHCGVYEQPALESRSMGDSRHQAPTTSPSWNSTTIENTGVTKGGSGANYDSSLPNH